MSERLDKRQCLYGEPRLSNAQVKALRELAKGQIDLGDDAEHGVRFATIRSLRGSLLVDVSQDYVRISPSGEKILALIDEAAAS